MATARMRTDGLFVPMPEGRGTQPDSLVEIDVERLDATTGSVLIRA